MECLLPIKCNLCLVYSLYNFFLASCILSDDTSQVYLNSFICSMIWLINLISTFSSSRAQTNFSFPFSEVVISTEYLLHFRDARQPILYAFCYHCNIIANLNTSIFCLWMLIPTLTSSLTLPVVCFCSLQ